MTDGYSEHYRRKRGSVCVICSFESFGIPLRGIIWGFGQVGERFCCCWLKDCRFTSEERTGAL